MVWTDRGFVARQVAIDQDRYTSVAAREQDRVIDLSPTCYVIPGLFDVHVHLRQPGYSYKETIASGTRAAARGGCTAVGAMPNLDPVPDSVDNLGWEQDWIERDALIDVWPYASITVGQRGRQVVPVEQLAPHVLGFSDDGHGVQDWAVMAEAMTRMAAVGAVMAVHAEDARLRGDGWVNQGPYAGLFGSPGVPGAAEYRQIERDLELVRQTGCRYHVCHVSTRQSVELIRAAKADNLPVSCETAPHYLTLSDADLRDDGGFRMNPPLRSSADRAALVEALAEGVIDCVATDHAPHASWEKAGGMRGSANGIVGLETAWRVLYTRLVGRGLLSLEQLVDRMAVAPRRLFGQARPIVADGLADLTVIDTDRTEVIDPTAFVSMGRGTPFAGWQTNGDVVLTIHHGDVVYDGWDGARAGAVGGAGR